jgi:hypothetical protein
MHQRKRLSMNMNVVIVTMITMTMRIAIDETAAVIVMKTIGTGGLLMMTAMEMMLDGLVIATGNETGRR